VQPPPEVVEATLNVAQPIEESERVLPSDGIPGAGAEHGDRATQLLDLEAPVHRLGLVEQVFGSKGSSGPECVPGS
jgi:hypothetical protein